MSIQAVAAVLETDVGEVAAKMLLVCIANAHNSGTGYCSPSIDRLAAESSMGRSTVKRWLKWLQDHHFIRLDERHDETGRQQSHKFILTLLEGSSSDPSLGADPQDAVEPNLDHRGSTGEPDEGSTAEPPLKKPEEQPNSPQPPLAGGLGFALLWEAYPLAFRGNRDNAEGAFKRLPTDEQASAIRAVPTTVHVLTLRKQRIPALAAYLRGKVFVEYDGAPPVDIDGDFVIKPGGPEWSAWLGAVRKDHGEPGVQRAIKPGFMIRKSRWPEGHVAHLPPLRDHS